MQIDYRLMPVLAIVSQIQYATPMVKAYILAKLYLVAFLDRGNMQVPGQLDFPP